VNLVDVLIPTCNRAAALAVTLSSLAFQTFKYFRVIVSDQSDEPVIESSGEVRAVGRVLKLRQTPLTVYHHVPRKGMAEQRQFLLERSAARYSLFLDDDLVLEPDTLERLFRAMRQDPCGFAGCGLIGLSHEYDIRPEEQHIEFWHGPVQPEDVEPNTKKWERYRLHNAANLYHLQKKLRLRPGVDRKYKVAWIGGCVMYDTEKLRRSGGFMFWQELPEVHCGEDVLAQLRVMKRYGGFGLFPSGVYHQELPTTLPDRSVVVPRVLSL
jgi:glycosyltransferase involved in cell wall biosynthesis